MRCDMVDLIGYRFLPIVFQVQVLQSTMFFARIFHVNWIYIHGTQLVHKLKKEGGILLHSMIQMQDSFFVSMFTIFLTV